MLINKKRIPIKQLLIYGFWPSSIKIFIYRICGYKIGKRVHLGIGTVIVGENVEIGEKTSIGFFTIIRGKDIKIGRFVKIGSTTIIDTEKIYIDDDAKINEQVFIGGLSGPDSMIKIGKRTIIMQMSFLNPYKPLIIGDDTGIGGHCLLFTHGSWSSQLDGYPVAFAPITLGKNVWLPWRVFIMPGVNVGDNVVIGANSLVSKNLPANCLAAGSPAKIILENYPPAISDEKRSELINIYFKEFSEYLEYNGYKVNVIKLAKNCDIYEIFKKTKHQIFYIKGSDNNLQIMSKDNLIVVDSENYTMSGNNKQTKMIINLRTKDRVGSSKVGEEFVNFIARYGLRFNRLD